MDIKNIQVDPTTGVATITQPTPDPIVIDPNDLAQELTEAQAKVDTLTALINSIAAAPQVDPATTALFQANPVVSATLTAIPAKIK